MIGARLQGHDQRRALNAHDKDETMSIQDTISSEVTGNDVVLVEKLARTVEASMEKQK